MRDTVSKVYSADCQPFLTDRLFNPLKTLLIHALNRIPEPTKENTNFPNTHILIELRDEFLPHLSTGYYQKVYRAMWNLLIIKHDQDPVIQRCLNHVLREWQKKPWRWPEKRIKHSFWRDSDDQENTQGTTGAIS